VPFLRRHPGYGGQDGTDSRLDAFQPRKLSGLATIIRSLRTTLVRTRLRVPRLIPSLQATPAEAFHISLYPGGLNQAHCVLLPSPVQRA
jgi:hypothetical protein